MSALNTDSIIEKYHWGHALESLKEGILSFLSEAPAIPYFTTDSAAALRASEIGC